MELRWYQQEAVNSIFTYYAKNTGNPVLALPTGTGKSLIIAEIIKRLLIYYPHFKILMLAHRKELIKQNFEKMTILAPSISVGIYSASLKSRDLHQNVIYAGVDSLLNVVEYVNDFNVVIIDEAHLVSSKENTKYRRIIEAIRKNTPTVKVIGLTATPYRLGLGYITTGGLFDSVAYNLTKPADFERLIAENYLSPLRTTKGATEYDTSQVKIVAGEFQATDLDRITSQEHITKIICDNIVQVTETYKKVLIFTSGLNHSTMVKSFLDKYDTCAIVDTNTVADERDSIIAQFSMGNIKYLINYNILTTGFDVPDIDCIAVLRPTMSSGLWVQMLGRGTRPAPNKNHCLVLDYAGNTARLGPIDDPVIPKKKGEGVGLAPVKLCPDCNTFNHIKVKNCIQCGFEFDINHGLHSSSTKQGVISSGKPETIVVAIKNTVYSTRSKNGKTFIIVNYQLTQPIGAKQVRSVSEFIDFDYKNKLSNKWFMKRYDGEEITVVCNAHFMQLADNGFVMCPTHARIWVNCTPYPKLLDTMFETTNTIENIPF